MPKEENADEIKPTPIDELELLRAFLVMRRRYDVNCAIHRQLERTDESPKFVDDLVKTQIEIETIDRIIKDEMIIRDEVEPNLADQGASTFSYNDWCKALRKREI